MEDLAPSVLGLNLNPPSQLQNTSWIRPMKYDGIWWGMHINRWTWGSGPRHGATTENAKRYLKDNPKALADIDARVRAALGLKPAGAAPVAAAPAPDKPAEKAERVTR